MYGLARRGGRGETLGDVAEALASFPVDSKECAIDDSASLDGAVFRVLYVQNVLGQPNQSFYVCLVPKAIDSFELVLFALHDGVVRNGAQLNDRIKESTRRRDVDNQLARHIYSAWVAAFGRARYLQSGAVGSNLYVSVALFSKNFGYMRASFDQGRPGCTTGNIMEVGRLMYDYVSEVENRDVKQILEKMILSCQKLEARCAGPN